MSDPVREAADAVLEALERVEIVAQASDMEDLDTARHDLRAALAADREPEPVQVTDEMVERAALAMTNELRRKVGLAPMASLDELEPDERKGFLSDVRIALAAALSDPPPEGEQR